MTEIGQPGQHVLVIDDEAQIRQFVRAGMELGGYRVSEAANGSDALREITLHPVDLVILDLALPDIDGSELLERIRAWTGVPVIILSVRNTEKDKVAALDAGADDYVTKPFGIEELLARIRAALRRSSSEGGPRSFHSAGLEIDFETRKVRAHGADVRLTPKEFELLRFLVAHVGKPVTHREVISGSIVSAAFILAVAGLWLLAPPHGFAMPRQEFIHGRRITALGLLNQLLRARRFGPHRFPLRQRRITPQPLLASPARRGAPLRAADAGNRIRSPPTAAASRGNWRAAKHRPFHPAPAAPRMPASGSPWADAVPGPASW